MHVDNPPKIRHSVNIILAFVMTGLQTMKYPVISAWLTCVPKRKIDGRTC